MKQLLSEVIRFQQLAGILTENVDVDAEFTDLGKELAPKIQAALQTNQPQNEDLATAAQIVDVILAAPVVLNFLGDKIAQISTDLGIKKGTQFGTWLSKYSSKLEGEFKKPINYVVGKFISDPKQQETVSEALYLAIVLGLGVAAGQGNDDTIRQAKASLDAVDAFKAAGDGDVNGIISKLT
jgi:hypothetical protein